MLVVVFHHSRGKIKFLIITKTVCLPAQVVLHRFTYVFVIKWSQFELKLKSYKNNDIQFKFVLHYILQICHEQNLFTRKTDAESFAQLLSIEKSNPTFKI